MQVGISSLMGLVMMVEPTSPAGQRWELGVNSMALLTL
jgi:hypothetical protein